MLLDNLILSSDSYKLTHSVQYPPNTKKVYSYFESRGGVFPKTIFFGLQYYLKKYLEGQVVTREKIEEAREILSKHMGPNVLNMDGWEYILEKHNGKLPIIINAVLEGTIVPTHNVLMTIENTDPNCFWLTNYLETLLVQVWYPSTVATQSYYMKQTLLKYLNETGDPNLIDFKLHDFGFRGVSSVESAGTGGAAHLVNFKGTDTIAGISVIYDYYNAEEMPAFSIAASEHSTITSWGKEHELDAFENMLNQYPEGLVACVSDSYDIYRACSEYWGTKLKDKIMARNGTLVVRPDSGHPPTIVPKVLEILGEKFGYTKNDKGYKVLDPHIRVIQGDGIDRDSLITILESIKIKGWSADNIAFGSGGGLLQKLNRDTSKYAFKCAQVQVGDEIRDVFKQPITDDGKKSKSGRLKLVMRDDYQTINEQTDEIDHLFPVFENGRILLDQGFEEIRKRTNDSR